MVDERPEVAAQHALRDLAEGSPQVRAAARLQAMADRHTATLRGATASGGGPVQRKAKASARGEGRRLPPAGPERALRPDLRATMEGALGMDFASVRLHEGPRASAMGALAYTQGSHIHFAPGHYQPDTRSGRELLGHELAHVVQQTRGRVQATGQIEGVPSNDDPGLEREADALGRRAAHGWASATSHRGSSDFGETRAPSSSPSPVSQSMPVQRVVAPRVDPNLAINHPGVTPPQAQQLYDDALQYLWTSPSARAIYGFIHADPTQVEVRVGSARSFASWNPGCLVEWNPFETTVLTTADTRTMGLANNMAVAGGLQLQQLHGTLPTAILLIHEMGHMKQYMETRDFRQNFLIANPVHFALWRTASGFSTLNNANPIAMDIWLSAIHSAIGGLHAYMGIPANQRPQLVPSTIVPPPPAGVAILPTPNAHSDIVEPDNLTRHELPVTREKGARTRNNYHATLNPNNLPANLRGQVNPPRNTALNWGVNHFRGLPGAATQLVPTDISTHLAYLLQINQQTYNQVQANLPRLRQQEARDRFNALQQYLVAAQAHFVAAGQAHGLRRIAGWAYTPTFANP
ncbi:DUF4157 domain-containing protein [Nannocystaceae bacterium ST9]